MTEYDKVIEFLNLNGWEKETTIIELTDAKLEINKYFKEDVFTIFLHNNMMIFTNDYGQLQKPINLYGLIRVLSHYKQIPMHYKSNIPNRYYAVQNCI